MDSFQAELGIVFNQRLENSHVINPKQVMISVLTQGINKNGFNFNYNNRDNTAMFADLGKTLCQLATRVPGGILLFFPSYRIMERCYETW